MIKGYEKNKLGSQVVKIEYEGQTITTINVEVIDYVQSVIITPPSKVEYNYGESLNLDGAKITKIMASNPSKPEEIIVTSSMISGYTSTKIGKQNVTITYVDDKTYTIDVMTEFVKKRLDEITKINLYDIGLSEEELKRRKNKKYELKKALKGCTYGDVNDKRYIKELIFDLLQKEYGVTETNISKAIPFDIPSLLTAQDKFDILIYAYKKEFAYEALTENKKEEPN